MEADRLNDLKRRLRQLKALEARLRFAGAAPPPGTPLVWDGWFDLHGDARGPGVAALPAGKPPAGGAPGRAAAPGRATAARYSLARLAAMDKPALRAAIEDYLAALYHIFYKERGQAGGEGLFDPAALAALGLPPGAGEAEVKRRFRRLALRAHPDTGGSGDAFIELMAAYRAIVEPSD